LSVAQPSGATIAELFNALGFILEKFTAALFPKNQLSLIF
jgi:hypothetical protein